MEIGDIVKYKDDWKNGRKWYLYDLMPNNLCTIVLIRNGKYTNEKNGEVRLNANIVNVNVENIEKCYEIY